MRTGVDDQYLAEGGTGMRALSERPRLLLLEDDPDLGPLLQEALEDSYDVHLARRIREADPAVAAGQFDVMVVDRRLPDGDGVDFVAALRGNHVVTPILMLTALGTVPDRVQGLDMGANDYLVKPFDLDELFARLRAIRRIFGADAAVFRIGDWEFFPESRTIHSPYEGRIQLTERESQLLALLASDPSRTFTRRQILEHVFGPADTQGVVDTYVSYLRRKTEPSIVDTIRGRGYRLGVL